MQITSTSGPALSLAGKTALITGGSRGIGAATVRELAAHRPAKIYIGARRPAAAEELIQDIHRTHPDANLAVLELDLASLSSVAKCAFEFQNTNSRLDWLILNAGIGFMKPALTKEGYELTFGTNHVGHAMLTQRLMPTLLATQRDGHDVRVLVTSSDTSHIFAPKHGLALAEMRKPEAFDAQRLRYGHSKLANVLFARKLAQVYPSIKTVSVHPGLVKTDIFGKADGSGMFMTAMTVILVALMGMTGAKGAESSLWCATAKDVQTGEYYEPVGKMMSHKGFNSDQKLAEELWEWTEKELAQHGGPGWPKA